MNRYEAELKDCKRRPTIASVVFESALMEGFSENGADIEILSYPMIPVFPNSHALFFGGCEETLAGYPCYWLRTINLPFIKQWSRRIDARKVMKAWAKENKGNGVIMSYSVPPFLVKDILRYGKRYGVKTVAIIPDLPANMYMNHKGNPVIDTVKQWYLNIALQHQGNYDAYIYLSEAMRDVIAPEKPYIVMEGILNMSEVTQGDVLRSSPRAIMYAGRLHEKYGVMKLVDAFEQLEDPNAELWLFGDGTAVTQIEERAGRNPRIRYFGSVSREVVLEYERRATLLVNPRSPRESFTKYSFPSKTIEYMASGTPLLTTRLEGIPREYFDYVFSVEENDVVLLKEALEKIFMMSDQELISKGRGARNFVLEQKKAGAQTGRILEFIKNNWGKT